MGCSASRSAKVPYQNSLQLTPAQKYLIRETWETIEQHQFSVGKGTFISFFKRNPEYQALFPEFKDLDPDELYKNSALYGHGKRVLKAVEDAVHALDKPDRFTTFLVELGGRHQVRALKPVYLDAMQIAFMGALKELLQSQWTQAIEEAWTQLFQFITSTMLKGLMAP